MSKTSKDTLHTDGLEETATNNVDNLKTEKSTEQLEASKKDAPEEAVEAKKSDCDTEKLYQEIESVKEQALRAQADAQNARRRAEQDIEKARKFALERFVNDLLPVADNLERAIKAGDPEDEAQKAILEGVQLTHKSLLDTLKQHKVEAVDPEGEPFDPQLHQAMSMVANPDVEPNTVLNVFQKGYTLSGRLVRPAMVVVSSSPTDE